MISKNMHVFFVKKKSLLFFFFIGLITFAIIKHKQQSNIALADQIFNVLSKYQIAYDIDAHSVDSTTDTSPRKIAGTSEFVASIANVVKRKEPVNMIIIGFPFKSPNHDKKTVSSLPDLAERKSLEYLQGILDEIKNVYEPGATITIFCDGIPFASFFGISFDDVIAYEKALKSLAADLPGIKLSTSSDFMQEHKLSRLDEINTIIDAHNPIDDSFSRPISPVLQKRVALELDHPRGKTLLKQQSLDAIIRNFLMRELRFRTYLRKVFPSEKYVRLTVHFSADASKKFGIRLSPDSDITPYHGVLVEENNGSWAIKFKKDINHERYVLTQKTINGIECPYFKSV